MHCGCIKCIGNFEKHQLAYTNCFETNCSNPEALDIEDNSDVDSTVDDDDNTDAENCIDIALIDLQKNLIVK